MSDFQAFCTSSDTEKKKLQVSQEKAETLRINFQFVFVLRFEFFGKFFPSFFFFLQCWFFVPVIYRFEFGFSKKQAKNWDRSVLQCLKIPEKVSFNITSEASYIYILRRQKFMKNAKMPNLARFWKHAAYGQKLLPDRSNVKGQKCKWDIWSDFQIVWI